MRSILGITALALAIGGCAATSDTTSTTGTTGESSEALSVRASLVGAYQFGIAKGNYEEYDHLTLDQSGSYTADKPNPTHGAALPESGFWFAAAGSLFLGPSHSGIKRYDVVTTVTGMSLTRFGKTELFDRAPVSCEADADCASGQECRFVAVCPTPPSGVHCQAGRLECVSVAHEGESCGFRTQTTPCARDLDCRHEGGTPLDALTCLPHLAQYGEACGGFVAHPTQCDAGLACSHVDADGTFINPDLPGVCLAGEGAACGGNMVGAHACASPLHCASSNPDVGGTCAQ